MITIDNKEYKVADTLGFQGGYQVKVVLVDGVEYVVVKRGGRWVWWTPKDKLG